ncbi:class I SAM-dependent methyltransferase [Amycolatopsis alkalitolerans]|uniref:Class I SAM-dependent methyltransferase n=2 Tax=Amycolatopsis alkalitolerans TaxID=2547244 RepID=A0A5C4LUA7_9PSEU|nr:class I SAM-dependent methyltransferase [Amycolatopsis alkalitolerans]
MLSPDDVDRIHRWHEQAANGIRDETVRTFSYLGHKIVVPPRVMPISGTSSLLGEAVLEEVREDDRVLDMGTGSGVNAILAASKSHEVVAVDISPHALEAARDNAARNGVGDRVTVLHSDVFSAVEGRFDLIVFDPPFRWFAPRDLFEAAITDEDYRALRAFFAGARAHLTPRGRMLVFFGTSGDLPYLKKLAAEAGFTSEVLGRQELTRDGWQVEYLLIRPKVGGP